MINIIRCKGKIIIGHDFGNGLIWGQMGRCNRIQNMANGCTYLDTQESQELRSVIKQKQERTVKDGPTEFVVEAWKPVNGSYHHLRHVSDTTYQGCTWLSAKCNSEGSECCGEVRFKYDNAFVTEYNDEECIIPKSIKYPLRDMSKQY